MSGENWEGLVDEWLSGPESSCVEWKQNNANPEQVGEYISAMANMAALEGRDFGYIVWGVDNDSRAAIGTEFEPRTARGVGNQALIMWLASCLRPSVAFEFDAILYRGVRLVVLKVPRASHTPVSFKDFEYLRIDSHIVKANRHPERLRMLWERVSRLHSTDWSGECVTNDWAHLDPTAVDAGRRRFVQKHPRLAGEVASWSEERFLAELRLAKGVQLTRAALLLFGKHTAVSWLGGNAPRLTWRLQDAKGGDLDYAHFELPFVLTADALVQRIRRLTVRILPPRQLAPLELSNYDDWVIREALLNCIAHQDYLQGGRVVVTERPDTLEFFNYGGFIPGSVERVLSGGFVEGRYRNPCLADAMLKVDLIDTAGSGIRRMFSRQRERFFPMPDFLISDAPEAVTVRLYGREIDAAFTTALFQSNDLDLSEVVGLDLVQKRKPVVPALAKLLRAKGLIEGRGTKLWISSRVARLTGQEVSYTLERGLDLQHYKALVLGLLKFGPQRREKLNQLLLDKLPSSIAPDKRNTYVKNLLREMAIKDGTIETDGARTRAARWRLKVMPSLDIEPKLPNP